MSSAGPIPVIVGVGAVTRHPDDLDCTTEPVDLISAAAVVAAEDASIGSAALRQIDSLDVLNLLSWAYGNPARAVAERIGAAPARSCYSDVGGEQPTVLIDAAADRISRGESKLAIVAGGETMASRRLWGKSGQRPPWSPRGKSPKPVDVMYGLGGGLAEVGLRDPAQIYPLVENCHAAACGMSLAESQAASARIWSAMSEVAAVTPGAWAAHAVRAEDIVAAGAANRPIAHPYLKLMCAQPIVDQAGAVIITSTEHAHRLGIPEDSWVYPWAGAGVVDTVEVLERPSLAGSEPLRRSILDCLELGGLGPNGPGAFELYSCFPIVPKLALEALGRSDTSSATVAGGLTFYGGPLNAYMVCATVAMVATVRKTGDTGLLYGNGGYLTKHHTLLVGAGPPPGGRFQADDRWQRQAEMDRRPMPAVSRYPNGKAVVETFTVIYDRGGAPQRGVIIGRLDEGNSARFAASVAGDVADTLAWLVSGVDQPVGRYGTVSSTEEAETTFRFA